MKYGFIGCGNMGRAILSGMLDQKLVQADEVYVHTATDSKMQQLKNDYQINICADNYEVVDKANVIFLAVKPHLFGLIFDEIKDALNEQKVLISIAAGQSLANMLKLAGRDDVKIIRTMPNTPVMVKAGMTALCANENCQKADIDLAMQIFNSIGKCEQIPESLMDAVPAVSGSSPAYVYMLINAMCDGAVRDGMSRSQARKFAAQAVLGSAKMVLESEMHPEDLKDAVCSPGGTTIEAVAELEKSGFRNAVLCAMKACTDKLKKMNQ